MGDFYTLQSKFSNNNKQKSNVQGEYPIKFFLMNCMPVSTKGEIKELFDENMEV